jgi:hexokinase
LVLDIGGTHTKAAFRDHVGTTALLFEHPNTDFDRPASAGLTPEQPAPLDRFIQEVLSECLQRAPHLASLTQPLRVGIIWSNQLITQPFRTAALCGITGIVSGLQLGGYRKGEWFLAGLRDGADLGTAFQSALRQAGVRPEVLVLGNDTVFTLFAAPRAHAGVVLSSGGNATALGPGVAGALTIFNTELGGTLIVPPELLTAGDRAYAATRGTSQIALEELCAGAWFSELCAAHLLTSELPALRALAPHLKAGALQFTNHTLSELLRAPADHPSPLAPFRPLLEQIVHRAGALAAVLVFLSVAGQITHAPPHPLTVALDSSMARHFPGYLAALRLHLRQLLPTAVECHVELLQPLPLADTTTLTVPLQGALRALHYYHTPAYAARSRNLTRQKERL